MYNPEIETAIFAAITRDPGQFEELRDILKPEYFKWECFQDAWREIEKIHDSGLVIDGIVLGDALEKSGKLQEFCLPDSKQFYGRVAISKIRDYKTTKAATKSYADIVLDEYAKRQLLIYSGEMATQSVNGRRAADIIADFEAKASKLSLFTGQIENNSYDMLSAVENANKATMRASVGKRDLLLGIEELDDMVYVFKQDVLTIAAQTSHGKTGLLCQSVLYSAKTQGKRWTVFTLESSHEQFTQRLIGIESGIETTRIMRGQIRDDELDVYNAAQEVVRKLPIRVIDISSVKISQIRRLARKYESDVIGLDYVQLVDPENPRGNRTEDVSTITRALKALAAELDIPIIMLAQLNRDVDKRSDRKPRLSDLRESGSIEQDSVAVVFIYRPDPLSKEVIQFLVEKNRNGPTGVVEGIFKPYTMSFESATSSHFNPNGYGVR